MLILGLLNMMAGLLLACLPAKLKQFAYKADTCAAVCFISGCALAGMGLPSL